MADHAPVIEQEIPERIYRRVVQRLVLSTPNAVMAVRIRPLLPSYPTE
jgi:hypothetical protein